MCRILFVLQICALSISGSCQLLQVLHDINSQQKFDTLLWLNHKPTTCFGNEAAVLKHFAIPKLIVTDSTTFVLTKQFNAKILSVICLDNFNDLSPLEWVHQNLKGMSKKNIVILLKTRVESYIGLQKIFTTCYRNRHLSVIVLLSDFQSSQSYFSYKPFPRLIVEKRPLNMSNYFADSLTDLQGHPLRTYPDQLQPRTLLRRNAKTGQLEMIGYIGRLLVTFAKHINATLTWAFPVHVGTSVFFTDFLQMARNRSLDIPASAAIVNQTTIGDYEFSRFIEIGKWFPMLPAADPLPLASIYSRLFTSQLTVLAVMLYLGFSLLLTLHEYLRSAGSERLRLYLDLIINERALLSLIGSSVRSTSGRNIAGITSLTPTDRLLFMLLFFAGLFVSTAFNTLLSSMRTHAPLQPEINSFADLRARGLKVHENGFGAKLLTLHAGAYDYSDIIHVNDNFTDFIRSRHSFNKSMAYATVSALWSVHERQQRYFARRLFRVSPHVSFNNLLLYALPLPADSIYAASLNRFIAQLHASGIFEYWYRSSFFDMIAAGLMSFHDLSTTPGFEVTRVSDFYWIWILLCFGAGAGCVAFLTELLVHWI